MNFTDWLGSLGRTTAAVLSGVLVAQHIPPEVVATIMEPGTSVMVGSVIWAGTQIHSIFSNSSKVQQIKDLKEDKLIRLSND